MKPWLLLVILDRTLIGAIAFSLLKRVYELDFPVRRPLSDDHMKGLAC